MCCTSGTNQITRLKMTSEERMKDFEKISKEDLSFFYKVLGTNKVCENDEALQIYNTDCYKTVKGQSKLLLFPETTAEVSQILKHCNSRNLAVTPQGGNTGLVAGSVPIFDEIIVSTSQMTRVYEAEVDTGIVTSQAGVTLRNLNEFAMKHDYIIPLDLASDEFCQIGGNVATNAGGLRFFRYGSLRTNVVGLEAVTANGDILNMMGCMKKDNTGYDLKQLFIGSEGTLGIVTKVAIQCPPKPKLVSCILLGAKSFEEVLKISKAAMAHFQDVLSCCEFMDAEAMSCVQENAGAKHPLKPSDTYEYFVLLELSSVNPEYPIEKAISTYLDLLDTSIKSFQAMTAEAMVRVWTLRKSIGMAVLLDGYAFKYDFSIPLEKFPVLLEDVRQRVGGAARRCCSFGHLADSNIHLVVTAREYSEELKDLLEPYLYKWVGAVNGSISAEHGIGFKERQYLKYSKSEAEIAVMKSIKLALDPKGILNPYKIFTY